MVDLASTHQVLREQILAGWRDVLDSGCFILGPVGAALEQECAAYLGVRETIGCGSGTDALHLSLRALDIGPGDEVITTPFTFAATAEAIRHAGARPVFADIDPRTFNLDATSVASALTPATRAIVPVHLFGQPAAMKPLQALANDLGIVVIEDAAQAFGARRDERQAGSFGSTGCFSFFPSKTLGGCGDGGLIATDSPTLASRLRLLRNHGAPRRNEHHEIGYTSRLDELQAVMLRAKLARLDDDIAARQAIARHYRNGLADVEAVVVPAEDPGASHVYHQYTILAPDRNRMARDLAAGGIETAVYYPRPLHQQPAFLDCRQTPLSVADEIAAHCLSLPIHPGMTEAQTDLVIDAIRDSAARTPSVSNRAVA